MLARIHSTATQSTLLRSPDDLPVCASRQAHTYRTPRTSVVSGTVLQRYCCMLPPTRVPASVSSNRISFPALTTTKLKFSGVNPVGVTFRVPVQSAFSVYVPEMEVLTLLPFTSKVHGPETPRAPSRVI